MKIDIPPRLYRELRKRAMREKRSVGELLDEILAKGLDEEMGRN